MVSTIRYTSFKGAGPRKYHPRVLIIGLALLVLLIWFYSRWTLLIMSIIYVTHGLVAKLASFVRPRRAETS
jgi:CDP-diacylglycerol--serine O-phosphatidyltransferase